MALINTLNDIGNAIREKTGGTELIPLKEMASAISGISSGTEYTNIVYNEDNTVTLTDKDGVVHTMSCTYEDGKLTGVNYDGKAVELTYNGDVLVNVGKAAIDMGNAPATSGGGAELNIAYGETAPEDTSKLWIKANEPANISVGSDFEGVESIATANFLPENISHMGCARVGTKIYLFGGQKKGGYFSNAISVFDTETNEFTILTTTLPFAGYSMGCEAVGNKIYLFGGYDGSHINAITVFDTETNTVTRLSTTLPYVCSYMGCEAVGNKIYLFGGYSGDRWGYSHINAITVFDTETNTVTRLSTTLPSGCSYMGCEAVGNKIYLFGGYNGSSYYNAINVFDTETNTVTTLSTTLPSTNSAMGDVRVGTKIYLFGGYNGSSYYNAITVFDTKTNTITTLSTTLPSGCSYMGCEAVGNKIYLFGGYDGSFLNPIEKFTLTHELANGDIEIQSGLINNKFNLINADKTQIEIGIENVYIGNENNEAENCEAYLHNGTEWQQI